MIAAPSSNRDPAPQALTTACPEPAASCALAGPAAPERNPDRPVPLRSLAFLCGVMNRLYFVRSSLGR